MPSESLAHITRAATAAEQDDFLSPIACRRRPQRRACPGTIAIRRIDAQERAIAWACTACDDTGTIAGFEGGENDLSGVAREDDGPRKRRKLRVSVQEYGSWISGNLIEYGPPELRTMYGAIYAHGHITMTASDDELDSLLDALAADLNHEERPTRRRNVESIFDELDAKLPPRRRATPVASSEPIADATSAYGHGFFCAIVAGPMVMPSAWLQRFVSFGPSLDDVNNAASRVMSAHNEVAQQLAEHPESFGNVTVRLAKSDASGRELLEWQRGFREAMSLNTEGWTRLLDDAENKELLQPLGLVWQMAEDPRKLEWLADEQFRENVGFSLGVMTVRIWEYFRAETTRMLEGTQRPPLRREPKISRNALCPCGSGKKFKRCCGA